ARECRHDGREPFTRPDRQAQALERLDDGGLSAGQMQAELRMAVYGTTQVDHLGLELLGVAEQRRDHEGRYDMTVREPRLDPSLREPGQGSVLLGDVFVRVVGRQVVRSPSR